MRKVTPEAHWPATWQEAYVYDREEVFDEPQNRSYALAYRNRRQETLQLLIEAVPRGARILDVAAAQGNFSLALAELGYRVTWNDLRAELAGYVQLKHECGDVRYVPGNFFELEGENFDAVLFTEVIEHVAHPDKFLAKISSVLKPNGVAVMSTPNGRYLFNQLPRFSGCSDPSVFESVQFKPNSDGHIFLLWPDEIRSLACGAGLNLEKLVLFTTPLTTGYLKMHYLLRVMPNWFVDSVERAAHNLPNSLKERLMVQTAARFRKPPIG
jgi:2-polyprenyl-6-hydroxyphenyl methylase/3-demethylubiquinone-9 3-methyltransferase